MLFQEDRAGNALPRCYLNRDLCEMRGSHEKFWGKRGPGKGNSKCKGPEVGKHGAYLGNSSEVKVRGTRNRVI